MHSLSLTVIGLLVGVGLVFFLKRFVRADLGDGPIAGIILVIPLLFLAAAGRLSEISGLGVSAKFAQAANVSVSKQAKPLKDIAMIRIDPTIGDLRLQATFQECHEYIVINDSGTPTSEPQLSQYIYIAADAIRASLVCGKFKGVIVTDSMTRYIGAFPSSLFLETSAIWTTKIDPDFAHVPVVAKEILDRTIFGSTLKYPSIRAKSGEGFIGAINENSSMIEALKAVHNERLPFLVLTNAMGQFKGIVSATDIQQQLLISLLD